MKKLLLISPFVLLAITGCGLSNVPPKTPIPTTTPTEATISTSTSATTSTSTAPKTSCNKEENCCVKDADCRYVWFTGVCNTPEYVAKIKKESEARGVMNGEAPRRDNVTCTCENAKCVTHG